jgi:hypothetical protein
MKQTRCKICRTLYTKWSISQKCCSQASCAIALVELDKAKKARKQHAVDKIRLKSRREWLHDAEAVMNQYVRLRDSRLGCVSCDKPSTWQGQWHCSHFRSVGAASAIRFNLWNMNKSCSVCNKWKSGNLSEYEPRLRVKIGDEKVDWLRTQNQVVTYSIEYLQRLIKVFRKKIKRLTK